tara:strand:+ start:401 stop:802 length:402 start_codon:yes stop_codon:yes gene_type:complete
MSKLQGLSVKLPLAYSNQDGPYGLNKDLQEVVQQNLKNLVLTSPGERVMQPKFGVGARRFLFQQITGQAFENLSIAIYEQVSRYMSFVNIEDIQVLDNEVDSTLIPNEVRLIIRYNIGSLGGSNTLQISQVDD